MRRFDRSGISGHAPSCRYKLARARRLPTANQTALRISVDHLLEGVQVIGFDWTYLYVNDGAAKHGRCPADALLGRTMMASYPGIERTQMFAALERVMRTRRADRLLNQFTYPDGDRRWFELRIEPVPDGICVLSVDVTDRQEIETQLYHAQKMEAVGRLAGGVAHDFNNILTAILGYAELLADQIGPDKPIGRDLEEIVVAAKRAARLTQQLLAFSRKQAVNPSALSLNSVVENVEPMLRRLITENITIRTSLDPSTYPVFADASHLEQVLVNLVVNARDAMPDGGVVTIQTYGTAIGDGFARDGALAPPGDYAVLTVADTGVGMTPEVRSRIFEPFYTTKDTGRGTGLGLAAVYGIVKQLGGYIFVSSEPGRGSVFTIYLPRTDRPVDAAAHRVRNAAPVGNETILLVEDEDGVRSFARKVLERYGYRVIEAASGEAALTRVNGHTGPIHLLLTDVMLAGMDGGQLARHVCRERTDTRVLFMSGYTDANRASLPFGAELLEKPFSANTLLSSVRQALEVEKGV